MALQKGLTSLGHHYRYAEDEVDALLALVIETLLEYEQKDAAARAEIDRLRSALDGTSPSPTVVVLAGGC